MKKAEAHPSRYVPALGSAWLTRFYDPLIRFALSERRWKRLLVNQAALVPGHRVLDLGCGTATLTIMLEQSCPAATVFGLDGDPQVLERGRRKAEEAGAQIELHEGMAFAPPFQDQSIDRIVSSLLFHHLGTEDKRRTFQRAFELLRPGGQIHIADWGKPGNMLMRVAYLAVQLTDGFETTRDNMLGRLPELLREAGFSEVAETHSWPTLFGTLSLFRATRAS